MHTVGKRFKSKDYSNIITIKIFGTSLLKREKSGKCDKIVLKKGIVEWSESSEYEIKAVTI